MNLEPEDDLRPELTSGEHFLWTGRPKRGLLFYRYDVFTIPFGLLITGFMGFVFYYGAKSDSHAPRFMIYFIFLPILYGLYMVVGHLYVDIRRRRRMTFGITDSRVIIKSGFFFRSVKSFNIKTLPALDMKESRDGSGSIFMGTIDSLARYSNVVGNTRDIWAPPGLESIPEVRKVYQLIIQLQRK
jgi:hypothetical protein